MKLSPTAVTRPFHELPPPRIPLLAKNSTMPSAGHASQKIRDVFLTGAGRQVGFSQEKREKGEGGREIAQGNLSGQEEAFGTYIYS